MSHDDQILFRTATDSDWDALKLLISTGFGFHPSENDATMMRALHSPENIVVATDGGVPVAMAVGFDMEFTVPGGHQVPTRGITWVSVAPTHRRRGILRSMFEKLHETITASGAPLAALTASDAGIYGRFGYGPATVEEQITFDRRFARFQADVPDPGGVSIVDARTAAATLPDIYDRWRLLTPGAQQRPTAHWDRTFAESADDKNGGSALFFLTHADGYVAYRHNYDGSENVVKVSQFVAITPQAYAALWRALIGLDLVTRIEVNQHPDDPLRLLLTDYRSVRTKSRTDHLWLRIMDVPAALQARDYAADLDTVIEIDDPYLDAGGTFRLRVRDGRATCTPTDASPQVTMASDVLSALYLGTHRARTFASAHRLRATDSRAVDAVDAAFSVDRPAVLGYGF
ncbi:enhanced intracellular survival protein Eis [Rhodococcus sp. 27YEA15]|uniref:enhanced intracellular survival protein Eis n=1 Tax=Rhodococcus sp. 27YEA15 TaxID=3156259 RepID=UPI003C79E4D2